MAALAYRASVVQGGIARQRRECSWQLTFLCGVRGAKEILPEDLIGQRLLQQSVNIRTANISFH
eukprot:364061-Rhodomonas_salina.1